MEITQDTTISHSSIWRHMKKNEYKSSVALGTLMLTKYEKNMGTSAYE